MLSNYIEILSTFFKKLQLNHLTNQIFYLSHSILNILLGFFIATALSTIPGQTGDWGVIAASILVTYYEIINYTIYSDSYRLRSYIQRSILLSNINTIKIGIIYGLFVDAFKLGS